MSYAVALAVLAGSALYVHLHTRTSTSSQCRPPGPRSYIPVIGNALDLATKHPWKRFRDWSVAYGDVVYLEVLRHSVVILNSPKAAFDLLDARSAIYSDRPDLTMVSVLDISWEIPLMRYGDRWREHRRLVHRYLNKNAAKLYEPIKLRKARQMLVLIRQQPEKWVDHINMAVGTVLLDLTYGNFNEETTLRYLQLGQETSHAITEMLLPGTLVMQNIPLLHRLPSWFPGASFTQKIDQWRKWMTTTVNEPFEDVKAAIGRGEATSTFVTRMLEEISHLQGAEYNAAEITAKNCAASVHGAGSDTIVAALMTFFLAMVLHPDTQKKAQDELMAVVGPDRLPEFSDRPSLPYIDAIFKECMRWIPVFPLGAFHATSEDDVYRGYHIPKGSIIFANQWAMLHDPEEYPDPESFNPDRFYEDGVINRTVRDPTTIAFGFGRRVCVGKHVADATFFISMASILHVYDILPQVDKNGRPMLPKVDVVSSLVSHPLPFDCRIIPRSDLMSRLIDSAANT
ncbi:cytochrome P450 [Daedaleopsis nitida]|nr:cytochrome P450 [Daedaleopsis nitida]